MSHRSVMKQVRSGVGMNVKSSQPGPHFQWSLQ